MSAAHYTTHFPPRASTDGCACAHAVIEWRKKWNAGRFSKSVKRTMEPARPAQGAGDGVGGDPNVHTPNIDRMARTGAYFCDAVSGFPLCCPYRGSMRAGLYLHKMVPGHERRLNPRCSCVLWERLRHLLPRKRHQDSFHEAKAAPRITSSRRTGAAAFGRGSATKTTTAGRIRGFTAAPAFHVPAHPFWPSFRKGLP